MSSPWLVLVPHRWRLAWQVSAGDGSECVTHRTLSDFPDFCIVSWFGSPDCDAQSASLEQSAGRRSRAGGPLDDVRARCFAPWTTETCFAHARGAGQHDCSPVGLRRPDRPRGDPCLQRRGLEALRPGSRRPHTLRAAFDTRGAQQLRALLHQSPRTFDQPSSRWTLELAAQVSFQQGLTPERVSGETIRATLKRLGVGWKRAKRWLTSPDPAYARKKVVAIV